MKRQAYSIMAAALLLASGALLTTACGNDDAAIDNPISTVGNSQPIQFTATLAPKSGDGAQTRAITTGTDGEGKEILNVTWKKNEQIAIYYETTNGHKTTTATVQTVDDKTGEATISATFDADAKNKGTANFVFPASLHNDKGDIEESQLLNNQNGLLHTGTTKNISKNFDAATATGTIAVSGSKATIRGTVAMQNRVCILKMALGFDDGQSHTSLDPLQGGNTLTIAVENGPTYTITSPFVEAGATSTGSGSTVTRPFQQGDVIYVAMLPVASKTVSFSSTASDGIYSKNSTGVTLQAGKFYRNVDVLLSTSTVIIPEGYKDLRSGSITAVDGDRISQSTSAATANTITIADGATVTLKGVNISTTGPGIICNGDATIILEGTNSVTSTDDTAVQIGIESTTTINGSGSLTATGGGGAGIGCSNEYEKCGNIVINGGTVTAFGGENAAGIGGGRYAACGNITINGGTVTATGGLYCAGIGSGLNNTCDDITITDGVTRVTANKGTNAPYSIGRDKEGDQRTNGTITIGGTVYFDSYVRAFQNGGETYLATSPLVYEPGAKVPDPFATYQQAGSEDYITTTFGDNELTWSQQTYYGLLKFKYTLCTSPGVGISQAPISTITINDGDGNTYTVTDTRDNGYGGTLGFGTDFQFYVSILPVSGKTLTITYDPHNGQYTYVGTVSNVTLAGGAVLDLGTVELVRTTN